MKFVGKWVYVEITISSDKTLACQDKHSTVFLAVVFGFKPFILCV